jgi:hypothetical protein
MCVQEGAPPSTDLSIRHEGVVDVEGIASFHVTLKVTLYYPHVLPDFRITHLEGVQVPCEQLAAIEAETNVVQALQACQDPLPAQFNYMCRMLHAAVKSSQAALHTVLAVPPSYPGMFGRLGKLRVASADH